MKHLAQLRVLVLGLGHSGLAMARWCAGHGATVAVWDSREAPPQADALRQSVPDVRLLRGALDASQLSGVQLLLKSPGLAPNDERIAPLLAAARAGGIVVAGELELFARALAELKAERGYAPKVVAITGTNGKTTTTAMTALLVKRAGRRVASAGNIGPTLLDTLADALAREAGVEPPAVVTPTGAPLADATRAGAPPADAGRAGATRADATPAGATAAEVTPAGATAAEVTPADATAADAPPAAAQFVQLPEVWVLELSSFQLDAVQGFEPSAAVVLNVTQDHLDWHGSMQAYAAAKARVFGEHTTMVVNRDDPLVEAMVPAAVTQKGGRGRPARVVDREVLRFGLDEPRRPGDYGLVVDNGMTWLVRALPVDATIRRRQRAGIGEDEPIHLQRLMPADALRVRGRHNAANALAALALAQAIGCALAPMLHGLRDYRGEPHRVEFIAGVGEVEAFDDSKGTNVGATVAALEGLGLDKAPGKLVVILGGDGKGQDFSPLIAPITRYVRAVALIGRDAGAIQAALAGSGVPMLRHDSLAEATAWCFAQAVAGDAVLLSPACASLDMFRNYAHRAEVFVAAVQTIAAEHGEALT